MGKIINAIKDALDSATEYLDIKTREIEHDDIGDYEFVSASHYDCGDCLCWHGRNIEITDEERIDVNKNEFKQTYEGLPVALDVFGNYIYLGDEVIPLAYNDNRQKYVSIKEDYETYIYESIDGPIQRNVLKKSVFDDLSERGLVTQSKKSGFYHVVNE